MTARTLRSATLLKRQKHEARLSRRREFERLARAGQKAVREKTPRREPVVALQPTTASLAGHFSGDGCVFSDCSGISVVCATQDSVCAFRDFFRVGRIRVTCGCYVWRVGRREGGRVATAILPFALGKQEQLAEFLGQKRKHVLQSLKRSEPLLDTSYGRIEEVVGGFLGSDGHITVRGLGDRKHPYVVYGQKYRAILDTIAENFPGGSRVTKCRPVCNGKRFEAYRLSYSGAAAMEMLRRVEPFITSAFKREIAREILHRTPCDPILCERVWGLAKANKDALVAQQDDQG